MIKRLVVEKLYDRFDFDLHFNEDLNLFTGRNGSGKTTLMKLMWGMLSGRIGDVEQYPKVENLALELSNGVLFQGTAEKETELFRAPINQKHAFAAGWGNSYDRLEGYSIGPTPVFLERNRLNGHYIESASHSLFFPTFRRGEGGYEFLDVPQFQGNHPLSDPHLANMVAAASNGPRPYHVFVNYTSMVDVDYMLAKFQGNINNKVQLLEKAQSDFVLERIAQSEGAAEAVLQEIKYQQQETNAKVAELMKPLSRLSELIGTLFEHKGIRVSESLTLGQTFDSTNMEHLSSGEKQMLSLLGYCMLCKNTIIFIDEPELSLSVDWQRLLVPMLLEFSNGNQYFMATHSPFIYAMYADKDIFLEKGKGGN
jgi:ABC-type multidrug transport system ATPase subunit